MAVLISTASAALAQSVPARPAPESAASTTPGEAVGELGAIRLGYSVVLRRGAQQDLGPGLEYDGWTPNDFSLEGSWFGAGHLGAVISAEREAFSLLQDGARVTGGALHRGHVGPSARVRFGPLRLEVLAAYHLSQLPLFGSTVSPSFQPMLRHSVAAGGRLLLALPLSTRLELRGLYPFALASSGGDGQALRSDGFSGAASLRVPLGHAGTVEYGVLANYEYLSDRLTGATVTGTQALSRMGLSLEVSFLARPPPPPPPRFGGVRVRVVDADTQAPLPSARVELEGQGEPRSITTGADGLATLAGVLEPGQTSAEVAVAGYLPANAQTTIVAGQTVELEVRAKKEPSRVGTLLIVLVDKQSAAPLANATVTVLGQTYTSTATGHVTIAGLAPGATAVAIAAGGYKPAKEVAMVVAGRSERVAIPLVKAEQRVLATVAGLVRGAGGGRPIAASLEIPEQGLKFLADEQGAFSVRVPGGRYRVIISAEGFHTQVKTVAVRDGDQAIFNVDLHPEKKR